MHKALLEGSSDDWAHGTIRVLECRLCPSADFSSWEDFKTHRKYMEVHPFEIFFCVYCGDFFACQDALDRRRRGRPPACVDVSPEMAAAKRKVTENEHGAFMEKLERCLPVKTNEDIGMPFAQIIKKMYPCSSKRQQSRLQVEAPMSQY